MTINFVTTCHKEGLDQYGFRLLANRHMLPGELVWYTEGYEVPCMSVDLGTLTELQEFKDRHKHYFPPSFTMDVVRFSHKAFAVVDELMDHDDLGVWIDADVIPLKEMPEEYVREQLPKGCYIAMFKRKGNYSECGYWVVDCTHPGHKTFMSALKKMYTDDAFKTAAEWHDSYLMDIIVKESGRHDYQYLLKGLDEPLEICEVAEGGQEALRPPDTTEKARRHTSPEEEPVLGWRPAVEQPVGRTDWVLEEKLGEGGFGEVWVGRHRRIKERRVFKFCFRADRVRSLKREMTLFR